MSGQVFYIKNVVLNSSKKIKKVIFINKNNQIINMSLKNKTIFNILVFIFMFAQIIFSIFGAQSLRGGYSDVWKIDNFKERFSNFSEDYAPLILYTAFGFLIFFFWWVMASYVPFSKGSKDKKKSFFSYSYSHNFYGPICNWGNIVV